MSMLEVGDWVRWSPWGDSPCNPDEQVVQVDKQGFIYTNKAPGSPYLPHLFKKINGLMSMGVNIALYNPDASKPTVSMKKFRNDLPDQDVVYEFIEKGTLEKGHVTYWIDKDGNSYVSYTSAYPLPGEPLIIRDDRIVPQKRILLVSRETLDNMVSEEHLSSSREWYGDTYKTLFVRYNSLGYQKHQCRFAIKVNDDPTWEPCSLSSHHTGAHRTYYQRIKNEL